jgi:hypothetical protein
MKSIASPRRKKAFQAIRTVTRRPSAEPEIKENSILVPSASNRIKPTSPKCENKDDQPVNRKSLARVCLAPETGASLFLRGLQKKLYDPKAIPPGVLDSCTEFDRLFKAMQNGDMRRPEEMALCQAHALQGIFYEMSMRAMGDNNCLEQVEVYSRLAFRAQAQCIRTLEAISAMKRPALTGGQLNVAHQQVVMNGPAPATIAAHQTKPQKAAPPDSSPIVRFAQSQIPDPSPSPPQ